MRNIEIDNREESTRITSYTGNLPVRAEVDSSLHHVLRSVDKHSCATEWSVRKGFWLSKRVLIFEMRGRCAKVNDTAGQAGVLLNRETAGKSFGEHSNLLRGTCYGIPKVLDGCNSSAIAKAERFREKTGTRKLFNRRPHMYTLASYGNWKLYIVIQS